jgi:hypothetical protein
MIRIGIQAVIVSQLADLVTSLRGMALGNIELNPLAPTPESLIALKLLATLTAISALFLARRSRLSSLVGLAAVLVSLPTLGAAFSNL